MAASFLPFCAHCDKQIVIPYSSILYCSESCRKKDRRQSSLSIVGSAPQTSAYPSTNGWSTPPIIPPYQSFADLPPPPTFVAPSSPTSARSMPFAHTTNSEPIAIAKSPYHQQQQQQNKDAIISAPSSPNNNSHNLYQPPRRPAHMYRSSTSNGSLHSSHPSTTSLSSASSAAYYPPQGQYRNHHRSMSHYSSSPRSLDLVTPISSISSEPAGSQGIQRSDDANTTTTTTTTMEAAGLLYEKKWALPARSQQGSLKKLFYFDDVRPIVEMPTKSRAASPIRPLMNSRSTSPAMATAQIRKKVEWE